MTSFNEYEVGDLLRWSKMSFDYKLLFAWLGSLIALWKLGAAVPVEIALILAAVLAIASAVLSVARRRALGWHWPGARPAEVLKAVFSAIVIAAFLFAGTPLSRFDISTLTCYLGVGGFGVFYVLVALNMTRVSKADYLRDCGLSSKPSADETVQTPSEARWKKAIRTAFRIAFFLVWFDGLAFMYLFGTAFQNGAPAVTAAKMEPLTNQGTVVYITPSEGQRIDALQTVAKFGIPAAIIFAFFLECGLGVRLFTTPQTRRGASV